MEGKHTCIGLLIIVLQILGCIWTVGADLQFSRYASCYSGQQFKAILGCRLMQLQEQLDTMQKKFNVEYRYGGSFLLSQVRHSKFGHPSLCMTFS